MAIDHDAFREWQRVSAGRMCDYSPFTWQQIEDEAACNGVASVSTPTRLSHGHGQSHPAPVPCLPFIEQPNKDYDLILNTGRTVEHWHTRTKTAQVEMLKSMVPNAWLEMNPDDAERLQLGRTTRSRSFRAAHSVRNLELRITGIVAPGQVFMPFHFVRDKLEPCHFGRIRSNIARTQFQAVCGPGRKVVEPYLLETGCRCPSHKRYWN